MQEGGVVAAREQGEVPSPCIGVCELDQASKLCLGCLRSADEIAIWRDAGSDVRRSILERVHRRRERGYAVKAG